MCYKPHYCTNAGATTINLPLREVNPQRSTASHTQTDSKASGTLVLLKMFDCTYQTN